MLCADIVEICWRDPSGGKQQNAALLEDISRSGMCLQFEAPISEGTRVSVHCPGEKMAGIVRYCVYREIGYFLGIELEKAALWSRKYEPKHLLDLQDMVLRHAGGHGGYVH